MTKQTTPKHRLSGLTPNAAAALAIDIVRAVREARGDRDVAARSLGWSRRTLYRWIDRLGISRQVDSASQ